MLNIVTGVSESTDFLNILQDVQDLHRTDYLIAQAMGYTGTQIPDSDGVEIASNFVEYSYLDGR